LQPFAGHKGYGIALMIEVLAGVLSGAEIRWEIGSWIDADPAKPTLHGAAFLAIDVGQITPLQAFKDRMDALIRDIRQTPTPRERSGSAFPARWSGRSGAKP